MDFKEYLDIYINKFPEGSPVFYWANKVRDAVACENLRELTKKYGDEKKLIEDYRRAVEIVPDKARFIENRITLLENTLKTNSVRRLVKTKDERGSIEVKLGPYKSLGFDWINNGVNAEYELFASITHNNITLLPGAVEVDDKLHLYYDLLVQLAEGAALAFHIAFLKRELVKEKNLENNKAVIEKETVLMEAPEKENDADHLPVPFLASIIGSNSNFPSIIRDFFYSLTPQPIKREDVSDHYRGDIKHYNNPFCMPYNGAYMLKHDWEMIESKMDAKWGKWQYYQKDVDEYLPKYAAGFKNGYKSFENDIIKPKTALFSSEENIRQIIFDQVTGNLWELGGVSNTMGSDEHIFSSWYDDGKRMGYFYKALFLIVENYKLFVPLFEEKYGKQLQDNGKEPTHREIILAHNFKIEAKIADFKTSSEWEKEGGAKRKQNFYTLDINNKRKYRKPTPEEIKKAIELLKDYPAAQEIAINKLKQL